ncbi:MAG TPA: ABC transporter substrate-binding protein [Roseovarius sp.]|uniref:ABC transporter substrate-binding protein n=1 Tax=Marivita sp. TaxID=2003365 RepID=UPI0025C5F793|nr:ABC transporter substrate-binding protein [Marivita sp.]HKL45757.1 ABC transporter substrate-binding protein [Roseovarius sp.]
MFKLNRRQFGSLLGATALVGAGQPVLAQDGKTLTIRFYDDPAGYDPANIFRIENENLAFNIFSGLTTYDSQTGEIIPDLATSWETTDNKTWTFNLRKGVQWQEGYGEFTAEDVIYSYSRILDPETASPYAGEFAGLVAMEAPDPYTLIIELDSPNGSFLHSVANYHQGQIVKKEAIEAAGDQVRWQPVGTGPYYMDFIDVNSQIILKRHDDYYQGPAPIETLVFNIIKDEATATIALRNGEVDLVMRSNREENLQTLMAEGFKMNTVDNYAVAVKVFNTEFEPFADARVRKAIAHAIDYDTITQALSPSLQQGYHSLLMPWMPVYTPDVARYPYDVEAAKALLAQAGYPDGFSFKHLGTSAQGVTELQQFEIDFLSKVGVAMEMDLVDTPTFNQRRNAGEFEMATRLLPAINPDMILANYLHPDNKVPGGLNGARYDNPEVTDLMAAAKAEPDPEKAKALYVQLQQIVMDDLPYLPTYANNVFWPGKQSVIGVQPNYLAQVNFWEVDVTTS